MQLKAPVSSHVFHYIEKSDIQALSLCRDDEIRPILPCLVRMSLILPLDHSEECISGRKVILRILSGIEAVNSLVAVLSIDFPSLEVDVKKEQQLRQKIGSSSSESILVPSLTNPLALEFECCSPTRKLRLLLSELLLIMAQVREPRPEFCLRPCEIFDNPCYLEEVSDVLCVALAELPALLIPADVAETLLHVSSGPTLISKMVANQPDCFREVVLSLVMNGEKQDEETTGGLIRCQAVRMLCQMNPSQTLNVRALCVEQCHMPGLAIYLTLSAGRLNSQSCAPKNANQSNNSSKTAAETDSGDVVGFVSSLLLSHNLQQRIWFAQFIKNAQRRKLEQPSALVALRTDLSERLRTILLFTTNDTLPESQVLNATALLRLFCALKNLANLKFSEDKEVSLLLHLLTCHPPPSSAGVRFVTTGLCMIIACPSLIFAPENERRAAEWIKWLVKEEAYFSGVSGVSSSFGAMLLLMAIHFHVQQLSAIIDLVSAAVGMKIITRAASLNKIKYIFTHAVFPEQVVTAHAAKIPVTRGLNSTIPGYLPVHCVYHQLKSRMFTKHKVPIKNWIFKQICSSTTPLHPVLPQLIVVYVNSILLPSTKGSLSDTFNEPISEEEIASIFSLSTFKDKRSSNVSVSSAFGTVRHLPSSRFLSPRRTSRHSSKGQWTSSSVSVSRIHKNAGTAATLGNKEFLVTSVMTSQLLLLYYLLLYEDVRINSVQLLLSSNRRVHVYSSQLLAQLPIRYLLSNAQKEQNLFAGLFSPLLKLLVTHYLQLCLLEDWLYQLPSDCTHLGIMPPYIPLSAENLTKAIEDAADNPGTLLILLDKMMCLSPHDLWNLAHPLTNNIKYLLDAQVPRKVLDAVHSVWLRLNSLFPRKLWAMTVEGLRPVAYPGSLQKSLSENDIVVDPLYVLRCDDRVFRCSPILKIVIYLLQVYLLSSQTYLKQHLHNNPVVHPVSALNGSGPMTPAAVEDEREKLRSALVLTQESAAVQILLEASLMTEEEKGLGHTLALQETRSIVCSYLHQSFIRDTTLAKLVQFQGYPKELLGPIVRGVPSMHIATDWIPEFLRFLDPERQVFAVELASHLALQNAMPSTLGIAKLSINFLATIISILAVEERLIIMKSSLQSLVRIGRAFPILLDDLVNLLVSYSRVVLSQSSLSTAPSPMIKEFIIPDNDAALKEKVCSKRRKGMTAEDHLFQEICAAFRQIILGAAMPSNLY